MSDTITIVELPVRLFVTRDDPALDQDRPLTLNRPCPCGCDERDGPMVGYLNVLTDGVGVTIVIEDEDTFVHIADAFGGVL